MNPRSAVIVAYGRSACCRARKGHLADTHPIEYSAQVLQGVLAKVPQLPHERIDDVILGCAMPVNQMDFNAARSVARRAGLPNSVPGQTINRFCSSSLQAIGTAANAILAGQMDCVIAGGTEAMSMCFHQPQEEYKDKLLDEQDIGIYMSMGETAERIAERYHISRREMEEMAVESHRRAHEAQVNGKLAPSIIPVTNVHGEKITEDEGIRPGTNMETLAGLKPCFRENGLVTAATSSQTTDASAFAIVMASDPAEELGIRPLARFISFAVAGCEAQVMGLGPIYAVPKAMARAGLTVDDMDVIELNEAFASQAIACMRELKLPPEKVNPYGGAMALGHPMGATGVFLTGKALDYLQDTGGRYALVTMCIGGGMGAAGIFEYLGS
ncbi:MAG: thiolase family protein [Oscillospiraceae bacterium]|nr:thiolase family protein [Oscillospiraceae bacterium]